MYYKNVIEDGRIPGFKWNAQPSPKKRKIDGSVVPERRRIKGIDTFRGTAITLAPFFGNYF